MGWDESGFNNFLERPLASSTEQSEVDSEVNNPTGLNSNIITSGNGNLQIDLGNSKIMYSDGRMNRQILPNVDLVVATDGSGDFADIQEAIDYAKQLGGATIFIKSGTYRPNTYLTLDSNIHLIGQDPETTIIDFSGSVLSSGNNGIYAGGSFFNANGQGTVSVTNGSQQISGIGTQFISWGVLAGHYIFLDFHPYEIASVESETSLTLKEQWEGASIASSPGVIPQIVAPKKNVWLENLTLRSNNSGTSNGGINFNYCFKVGARRVKCENFSGSGFYVISSFNFIFSECEARNCSNGFYCGPNVGTDLVTNGSIINSLAWNNTLRGIYISDNTSVKIIGCSVFSNDLGIRLDGERSYVGGCDIEVNRLDGVRIYDGQSNQIIGNTITSNGSEGVTIMKSAVTSDDNKIIGNEISRNGDYGILIQALCQRNIIQGNTTQNNANGAISDAGFGTLFENVLGYAQITTEFSTASTSLVYATGLTTTVTIPSGGRKVKITAFTQYLYATGAAVVTMAILDGPTSGGGTQLTQVGISVTAALGMGQVATVVVTPEAGSKTYNVWLKTSANTGAISAGDTYPAFILVEAL